MLKPDFTSTLHNKFSQIITRENSNTVEESSSRSFSSTAEVDGRAKFHYSDIRNRKFGTKFLPKRQEKIHRKVIINQDSVIIQNDRKIVDDISFSEEIVGSEKTVYSSDKTGEGKVK
jgi:hypothetical protein